MKFVISYSVRVCGAGMLCCGLTEVLYLVLAWEVIYIFA
jgi:hypothetical protein